MKTYRVTVNGEVYEVTVEESTGGAVAFMPSFPAAQPIAAPRFAPKPAAPKVAAPKPAAPKAAAPKAAAKESSGGGAVTTIQAPMPGKVMSIKVAKGDVVKNGTPLLILEAMKMENDILSSVEGTVQAINVEVGKSVNTGDKLIVIG